MATAAEVVRELAAVAGEPVTVATMRSIIETARGLLDALVAERPMVLDDTGWSAVLDAAQRTRERLDHAWAALDGMEPGARIEPGTEVWRQTVAPLLLGICYGPPYCDVAHVEGWGGAFPIAPVAAEPWVLGAASAAWEEARAHAWAELGRELEARGLAVAHGIGELGRMVLAAAVGWFIWRTLDEE